MGISSGHTTYRMISSVVGTLWDAPWFNKNEGSSKKLPVVAKDGSWKIEAVVKQCPVCQESRPSPPLAPLHPWKWPSHLWSRIHLDCDGQYMSYRFLVIVDAHSKWLDAHIMSTITLSKMIESAMIGIYDSQTTSNPGDWWSIIHQRWICSVHGSKWYQACKIGTYHPSSNSQAERAV